MPRPTTKSELLAAASASFKKLTTLWDGFTPEPVSYTHLTLPTICSV